MDAILTMILIVLIGAAILPTVKHFRGQGGCCGGMPFKAPKKKLTRVAGKCVLKIEGMHCVGCANRITEAINAIPGHAAKVNLRAKTVTVEWEEHFDAETVRERVQRAGYKVTY